MNTHFPNAEIVVMPHIGHGGMVLIRPDEVVRRFQTILAEKD